MGYYAGYNKALASLYSADTLQLAGDGGDLFTFDTSIIDDAIKTLHAAGKFTPETLNEPAGRALIGENYRILSDGISKGTAAAHTSGLKHEIPAELSAALNDNAYIFSGFKAYHTMNEAGLSLRDTNGGIKDFETFRKEAGEVFKKSGLNLRAEYQHATQAAQMAAKWHDIEADGDRYDLQYRTVGDNKVREEHATLDKMTLPPSDPFWSEYYPPNGWGCRCTAVQVRKGKYPQGDSADAIKRGNDATPTDKQKIFRFNAGQQKKVFPDKHPTMPKGCGNCNNLKLNYNTNNPLCKACTIIVSCKDKELKKTTPNKWIADTIEKVGSGKVCKRSVEVCKIPKEVVNFSSKQGIVLADGGVRVTDAKIMHALRPDKVKRGQAISKQQMAQMADIISQSNVYFDSKKKNFVFVVNDKESTIKFVIQPNYKTKADGKNECGNHFITAGKIKSTDISPQWEKIK